MEKYSKVATRKVYLEYFLSKFKFKTHIDSLCRKFGQKLSALVSIRKHLTND